MGHAASPARADLAKTGSGTLTLTSANSYTGGTTVDEGMLVMGVPNAVPSGADLTVNGTLDLDGNSLLVENFSGAATGLVTSSQAGAVTLTVAGDGQTTAFAGDLEDGRGQLALAKTGTDELIVSGTNSYSGGTTLSAGTLSFANGSLGTDQTWFAGGTLQWTPGNRQDVSSQFAAIASGRTAVFDTNGNDVTLATAISGGGGLTRTASAH